MGDAQPLRGESSDGGSRRRKRIHYGGKGRMGCHVGQKLNGGGSAAGRSRCSLPARFVGSLSCFGGFRKSGDRWFNRPLCQKLGLRRSRCYQETLWYFQPSRGVSAFVHECPLPGERRKLLACDPFQAIQLGRLRQGVPHRSYAQSNEEVDGRKWRDGRGRGGPSRRGGGSTSRFMGSCGERGEGAQTRRAAWRRPEAKGRQGCKPSRKIGRAAQATSWRSEGPWLKDDREGPRRFEETLGHGQRSDLGCERKKGAWTWDRWPGGRARSRGLGGPLRQVLGGLFTLSSGREAYYGDDFGGHSEELEEATFTQQATPQERRAPTREEPHEERWGPCEVVTTTAGSESPAVGGYKRFFFQQLAEAVSPSSCWQQPATCSREGASEGEEQGHWSRACQDPYQSYEVPETWTRCQEEEKEEEKAEAEERAWGGPLGIFEGISDLELLRRLGERAGELQRGGEEEQVRASAQAPGNASPRLGFADACGPCSLPSRPVIQGGVGQERHRRHDAGDQDCILLLSHPEASDGRQYSHYPGAPSLGECHRYASCRDSGFSGGPDGESFHGSASGLPGRGMECSSPHGASSPRGGLSCRHRRGARSPSSCPYGSPGAEPRELQLEGKQPQQRRTRKRKLARGLADRQQRTTGQGRQRTRKRKRMVEKPVNRGRCRGQQEEGEGAREVKRRVCTPLLALAAQEGSDFCEGSAVDNLRAPLGDLGPERAVSSPSLRDVVTGSSTFALLGVRVAWWFIAGVFSPCQDSFTDKWLWAVLRQTAAKIQSPRPKGATFPLRLGELNLLVDFLRSADLDLVSSAEVVERWKLDAWLFLSLVSLNALAGAVVVPRKGRWSKAELQAVNSLRSKIASRCQRDVANMAMAESMWQKDLGSKHVGYGGEEISTCQVLTWDQVLPSLPPPEHGASIETLDWVGPQTRSFLLNPEKLLKDVNQVELPRMPGKIHVDAGDKLRIAKELVRRRICDWIPLEKVYHVNSTPVLNGLFGVCKTTLLSDGRPILRLIMNLTGSNSTQLQLEGGCSSLPNITSWQSLVIEEGETLSLFQSDMSSAFYLFRLPSVWKPHLAFNVVVQGDTIFGESSQQFALCCNVIPMGWLNSVGIMQEISENLMKFGSLKLSHQIFRDRHLPPWLSDSLQTALDQDRTWYHVYLDNFAAGERLEVGDCNERGLQCHEAAERAWSWAGVVSSAKKRVSAERRITELGASVDGDHRTLGVGTDKLLKVAQATLWLLVQPFINRKHLQIIAGRWVFILQFRRPAMGYLDQTWKLIGGAERITEKLRNAVKGEMLHLLMASALLECNLGAKISEVVVATDASESAGAVGVARDLTPIGRDFLCSATRAEYDETETVIPVLLLSLFNGIGGAFRSYDLLGVAPMVRIAVEKDDGANRITSRRWPGTVLVKDVSDVTRELVREWSRKYLQIKEIHLWAGFPCTDLSKAKFGRLNLWGEQSSLFWHVPRITSLVREEFGENIVVKRVCENVASMDRSACEEISWELDSTPYLVDCVHAVPMRRPRYAWSTEKIEALCPDVHVVPRAYWNEVWAEAPYPDTADWLTEGHTWQGELEGAAFPTCMKSIPRKHPPPRPAGLDKCDWETVERWKSDEMRYPPYQYADKYLITTDTSWRLLSCKEKELLLGYGYDHTAVAWSASKIKQNKTGYFDAWHSYLGDSFSIYSFVLFALACCKAFLPVIPYQHLAKRMGVAPGFRMPLRLTAKLAQRLVYGSPESSLLDKSKTLSDLNRFLLRKTNHTGSDIRVISGDIYNSKAFPRIHCC